MFSETHDEGERRCWIRTTVRLSRQMWHRATIGSGALRHSPACPRVVVVKFEDREFESEVVEAMKPDVRTLA